MLVDTLSIKAVASICRDAIPNVKLDIQILVPLMDNFTGFQSPSKELPSFRANLLDVDR